MQLPGRILATLPLLVLAPIAFAQSWCDAPPSAELADLKVIDVADDWFKAYQIVPGVFAIAEPRQAEGVNSFLIVGRKRAVLFDSGLGVAPISKVVQQLTSLPVTVVNSHTHFDHVGGNSDFSDVRNLDIPYSQASARGQVEEALATYARATLSEDNVCGRLPSAITSRDTGCRLGMLPGRSAMESSSIWAGVHWKSSVRRVTHRIRSASSIEPTDFSSRVTRITPVRSISGHRVRI